MTSPPPVPTSLPASDPATASASAASFPLEAILRPSEAVRETAPCRLRTSVGRLHAEVAVLQSTLPSDRTESCVLVYVPASETSPIRILHALPITETFSTALLQTPPSPSTSFFAQSSKPHIELVLDRGFGPKVELLFAPSEAARVRALVKAIRKAIDTSYTTPIAHAWVAFYPEDTHLVPEKTEADTLNENLEASFGKLDTSDSDDSGQSTPVNEKKADDDMVSIDMTSDTTSLAEPVDIDNSAESGTTRNAKEVTPEPEDKAEPRADSKAEDDTETEDSGKTESNAEDAVPAKNNGHATEAVATSEAKPVNDDSRFPNPYHPSFNRTSFLRERLFERQDKWSTISPVSVRVVTYNVNDRVPPTGTQELGPIIGYGAEDILAVGLQEVDLRSSSLFVWQGADRAQAWEDAIYSGLGDNATEFETLSSVQYVGVLLIVLVRKTLRKHVTMVQGASKPIGLLGVGGNKAGVAVRLKVYDTTITFVSSHLAAFANQLERRRYDYQALRTGLTFPLPSVTTPTIEAYYPEQTKSFSTDDCDILFWSGDLNYRLDLDDQEVWGLVQSADWEALLVGDQLLNDISQSQSFTGFSEPKINFRPTFKYVHGSVTLDPKRAPAYTDRVLHLSRGPSVESTKYTSHELLWSDHLPVSSTYLVGARVADDTKRSEELIGVQCELDKLDELYRASLAIDETELDFGTLKYGRGEARELILRNTGRVPAPFSFRAPSPGKGICKPWFWPFPAAGVVGSGQELRVIVTADVGDEHAAALTGGEDMNDVLVLQVAGGKDSFVSLRAQLEPTIVGLPLVLLPLLPDVIRNVPLAERRALVAAAANDDPYAGKNAKPPREVWRLLERLISDGPGVPKLWTGARDVTAMLEVLDALDSGAESLPGSTCAAAHALLHILAALRDPLVPLLQQQACTAAKERYAAFGAVEKIPSIHANVLIGLMSVAKLCAGAEPVDDASVKVLAAAVFAGPPTGREGFIRALIEG